MPEQTTQSTQPTPADGGNKPLLFTDVLAKEYEVLRGVKTPNPSGVKELQREMDKQEAPLSALCISGGGIRSATFALGILQGLAEKGLLGRFDYLSTVSGGGFIGGWLTAWRLRAGGIDKVQPKLSATAEIPKHEHDPVQHLREYNNYLSPKLGFFSSDTWTLVATVARNILLNWLVIVPLLAFALMLPRIILSLATLGEPQWYQTQIQNMKHGLGLVLAITAGVLLAAGIYNALKYLPGVGNKDHSQADFLRFCLGPIVCSCLAFITLEAWVTGGDATKPGLFYTSTLTFPELLEWITGACLIAWVAYFIRFRRKVLDKPRLIPALTATLTITGAGTACGVFFLAHKVLLYLPWPLYVTIVPPLLLLCLALTVTLFVGMTSIILKDEDREWLSRAGAWLLLFVVIWAGSSALVLLAPAWVVHHRLLWQEAFGAAGGLGGIITALGGFVSGKHKEEDSKKDGDAGKSATGNLLMVALQIAAFIFVVVFLTALSLLTNWLLTTIGQVHQDWLEHRKVLENTGVGTALIFAAAFLVFGWIMARFININKFSLHAMYRERLIRAYLGASNPTPDINKFTGFSDNDNLDMSRLATAGKPFHVVNTTLNLVAGKRLAWQQRKAEPFTVSALHCGNSSLGYRSSTQYGGKGGISLGTAVTLSGAAASPNMGYYSSPLVGFIMTLFNARLGAWLGNPGNTGKDTWRHEGPNSAVNSLVREAFGLTNDTSPYVYLSDGGHFENLALYEMVKRGCRLIVVIDGAADGEFAYKDFGNALRKIRIDMKVPIEFSSEHTPEENGLMRPMLEKKKRCSLATIRYKDLDPQRKNGYLLYIKPMMLGTEPPDICSYHALNPAFPHQSTANQWFDEPQTESYRMLAYHTIKEMSDGWNPEQNAGLEGFINHIENHYLKEVRRAAAAGAGR